MLKKIVKVLSVAAVLATAASAAGPRCTIDNFLDQGKNYMKYVIESEFYKAFTGNYKNMSSTSKSLEMQSTIQGGINGIVNRIKNDLGLTDVTLHLKNSYGQTFTINLQDATLNVYKYYYSHLYKKLKYANKSYRQQFIAAAIDIADFMYIISLKKYKEVKEAYIRLAKTFADRGRSIKSVPFLALVIIKEAENLQNLSNNPNYYNSDLEAIISGIIRGYIVAQRDRELKRYIPSEFLDFAFYTMTGNFEKADQIILKEIQKGGGFTGIMQYCLVEQLKYRNR